MTREAVTLAQIHNLLSIAGTMAHIAVRREFDEDDNEVSMSEAQIAAENTFIKACEKLDDIMGDPLRWDLSFQQQQEQVFLSSQQRAAAIRINAFKESTAPHVKYDPSLFRTIDGKWMALLGNPDTPGSGVTGVGNCPQEALDNFDAAFEGRAVTIDPVKWADELNTKHNEQQKLDGVGAGSDINNEAGGQLLGADSGGAPGQDPGWLPDNQRPEAEGDGEGGPGTEGKPA